MKTNFSLSIALIVLLTGLFSSCKKEDPEAKYDAMLEEYEGKFVISHIDFNAPGIYDFDLDDDGIATANIIEEMQRIQPQDEWLPSTIKPVYGKRQAVLDLRIPIFDYWADSPEEAPRGHNMTTSLGMTFYLDIAPDMSASWSHFYSFGEVPRTAIGQRTIADGDVDVDPNIFHLSLKHYLIYDYLHQKYYEGELSVIFHKVTQQ